MMELMVILILLSVAIFFAGLLIAIIIEEKRKLGLIMMLISVVIFLIGLSLCSKIILIHGSNDDDEEIDNEFFILEYAPTTDSMFCDSTQILPTDFMVGWMYFGDSGRLFNYSLAVGEFDSLRIESGSYKKEGEIIECTIDVYWSIPYYSVDNHSIHSIDIENLVRKRLDPHTFILNKNKCESYPYFLKDTFANQTGLIFKNLDSKNRKSKDLLDIIERIDND